MDLVDRLKLTFVKLDLSLADKDLHNAWVSGCYAGHAYNMRKIYSQQPETNQEKLSLKLNHEAVQRLIKSSQAYDGHQVSVLKVVPETNQKEFERQMWDQLARLS